MSRKKAISGMLTARLPKSILLFAPLLLVFLQLRPEVEAQSQIEDKSCHNPFARGAARVLPSFSIDVAIENGDWDDLTSVLEDYAKLHDWSFRNTSKVEPGVLKALYLSLCTDSGLLIRVTEQRWAARDYTTAIPGRGVEVPLYATLPRAAWRPVAIEVVGILESHWPGRVRFRGADGELLARPEFLRDPAAHVE
jgi:hypothetical protein